MARLICLPQTKHDILRLHEFIKAKNPKAAQNAIKAIRVGAQQLQAFPFVGTPMNDGTERHELYLAFGSAGYVLRYRIDGDDVIILWVYH